jgi:Fic family protein
MANPLFIPIGQIALHGKFCPRLPPPFVRSYAGPTARRTAVHRDYVEEFYPLTYFTENLALTNIRFALKYESLDLRILASALRAIPRNELEDWIRAWPTGGFVRRVWYFFETFIGPSLDIPDAEGGNYVDALDPKRHYVSSGFKSRRHRVNDNFLGGPAMCPVVRKTAILQARSSQALAGEAKQITDRFSYDILSRAVSFLYTKETKSSFALEGETPSRDRQERFLRALRKASTFLPADEASLTALQASIVDARYAADGWRSVQNFVGSITPEWKNQVEFICPRPEDVPKLMSGWLQMTERLRVDSLDCIVAAAVSAFSFVFVHPFEDGNGRIHRFLFHAFLASRQFGPPGVVLPVSAAILRQKQDYDRVLDDFSRPLLEAIDWKLDDESGCLEVTNETFDLYRFFDATGCAEFLYERMSEAINQDLLQEATFLKLLDGALSAIRDTVDMPDKRAVLLAKICLHNGGRLSNSKRNQFEELTDSEVGEIEARLIRVILDNGGGGIIQSSI